MIKSPSIVPQVGEPAKIVVEESSSLKVSIVDEVLAGK